ncbi:MAG: hypothetical protein JW910_01435, partial [Anaerolineae bacterium]|nr:hypothetical protein [Anaerolineae bacterium]
AMWGGLMLAFTLVTIPLAWGRYYMPLYPVQVLLAGAGAGWLARLIAGRATASRLPGPDSAASRPG